MKQSLSWWCFEGRIGLDDLLIAAKRIGLAGIELIDPELWGVVQRHGLEIASHRGHTSIESGLNQYANHNRIEREFVESIQLAERWHIPNLIAFAGTRDGRFNKVQRRNS